jgi:hypothetical protein
MSQAQFTIPLITVIPGQLITANLWNNEFLNLQTNLNPLGLGAYMDTTTQAQIQTAPYPSSILSLATSLGGEIERLRYQLAAITGNTYWYQAPTAVISALLPLAGGTMTGPIAMGAQKITGLANGTAAQDAAAFGQIDYFQTIQATGITSTTLQTNVFTPTVITGSITPSSTAHRIKITVSGTWSMYAGVGNPTQADTAYATIMRGSTNLGSTFGIAGLGGLPSSGARIQAPLSLSFIDSPASVSPVIYTVNALSVGAHLTDIGDPDRNVAWVIILEEIT